MTWVKLVLALLVLGGVGLAQTQNTAWLNPSADRGQFLNGPGAYAPGGPYAVAVDAEHLYWGYGVSFSAGTEIVGIEVLLRARRAPGRVGVLRVELSGDGGMTWTATGYAAADLHPVRWREYVLGGSADTWGWTWTGGQLADGLFRVRVRAEGYADLDWLAVRVHYRQGIGQALTVAPLLMDLGTVTLADYDRGYRELSPAQRITVSSPTGWSLFVASESPVWTYTGSDPSPGKPCSHLEWRVSAFGAGVAVPQTGYRELSTGQQKVAGGTTGADLWLEVSLRLRVDYETTVPGTYELRFTYTLTAP